MAPQARGAASGSITVDVQVQTRGSRSEILGYKHGRLRIKTTAAPDGGKANEDVIRQLAEAFRVPRSRIRLVRGPTSRQKTFEIAEPGIVPEFAGADDHEDRQRRRPRGPG